MINWLIDLIKIQSVSRTWASGVSYYISSSCFGKNLNGHGFKNNCCQPIIHQPDWKHILPAVQQNLSVLNERDLYIYNNLCLLYIVILYFLNNYENLHFTELFFTVKGHNIDSWSSLNLIHENVKVNKTFQISPTFGIDWFLWTSLIVFYA